MLLRDAVEEGVSVPQVDHKKYDFLVAGPRERIKFKSGCLNSVHIKLSRHYGRPPGHVWSRDTADWCHRVLLLQLPLKRFPISLGKVECAPRSSA